MDAAHALVIGIGNYQCINKLPPCIVKDAQDIYNLLIDPRHCGYLPDNVQLLLDGRATQEALRQALADLAERSNADAIAIFYISSHGGWIESGPHAGEYLLPVDTVYTSDASLAQRAISVPSSPQLCAPSPPAKS
jgi:Caspase domain